MQNAKHHCTIQIEKKKADPTAVKKKPKKEEVKLLDPKRSSQIDIGLVRFKMSHAAISDAIVTMDKMVLNPDVLGQPLSPSL